MTHTNMNSTEATEVTRVNASITVPPTAIRAMEVSKNRQVTISAFKGTERRESFRKIFGASLRSAMAYIIREVE